MGAGARWACMGSCLRTHVHAHVYMCVFVHMYVHTCPHWALPIAASCISLKVEPAGWQGAEDGRPSVERAGGASYDQLSGGHTSQSHTCCDPVSVFLVGQGAAPWKHLEHT